MIAKNGYCRPRLLVFLKSPEEGKVKSRLAERIGEEKARELYRNFVLDLLETLDRLAERKACNPTLCIYPPEAKPTMRNWLGDRYDYLPQRGSDLGERMKNAFLDTWSRGFDRALLMGSDLPDLPETFIEEGLDSLKHLDAVIGPSSDGGYYLIGFSSGAFVPGVFEGMNWGTGEVFKRTLEILRRKKAKVSVLPAWRDIDTYEDLMMLSRDRSGRLQASRTMRYLLSQNLMAP